MRGVLTGWGAGVRPGEMATGTSGGTTWTARKYSYTVEDEDGRCQDGTCEKGAAGFPGQEGPWTSSHKEEGPGVMEGTT